MPKFYFDVSDGRCSPDTDGIYLTDDMAARREAVRRVAMLLRVNHNTTGVLHAWRMTVKDESGAVLFDIEAPTAVYSTPILRINTGRDNPAERSAGQRRPTFPVTPTAKKRF